MSFSGWFMGLDLKKYGVLDIFESVWLFSVQHCGHTLIYIYTFPVGPDLQAGESPAKLQLRHLEKTNVWLTPGGGIA